MKILLECLFLFLLTAFFLTPYASGKSMEIWKTGTIRVQVTGEVENPGIYDLESGATVADLLALAVPRENAEMSALNETIVLKDHDCINIPSHEEEVLCVSINTASLQQLMLLPGVGKVTAQNIIDCRNSNGLFQSIDDLIKVKGIGTKTLEKLRPYVCL